MTDEPRDPPEGYIGVSFNVEATADNIFEEDLRLVLEPDEIDVEYHHEADDDVVQIVLPAPGHSATVDIVMDRGRYEELVEGVEKAREIKEWEA